MRYFEYFVPVTLNGALMLLNRYGDRASLLAGGTDLVVSMKKREMSPDYVINLKGIPGLNCIDYHEEQGLRIGALATFKVITQYITSDSMLRERFGLLASACNKIGSPQIRNMGTIGGNICKAGPSQDTPPSLLVLNARLKLASSGGERTVPIDKFFIGPFKTIINNGEILTEILIPSPPPNSAGCYKWRTKISTVDETLVGVAVLLTLEADNVCQDARIALCSVGPTPYRCRAAEEVLRGEKIDERVVQVAANKAKDDCCPRSRDDYRRTLTGVLVERAINEVRVRLNSRT